MNLINDLVMSADIKKNTEMTSLGIPTTAHE